MLQIKFSTANDAFDNLEGETARILRELADMIERGKHREVPNKFRNVVDSNGNVIGTWKLSIEEGN